MRSVVSSTATALAGLGLAAAQTAVTVNLGTTFQVIDGFGISDAFGQASSLHSSSAATQGVNLLFSKTSGAGFTILRNRIGSGGSGDSIEPTSPGSPTATPKYVWDDNDSGQVWLSQQARLQGVEYIYADAWSAPGFMKTNNNQDNGGSLCGVTGATCSSGDWRQAYADFLVQYVKYYNQSGIKVDFVGFLNEPEYNPSYSSMISNGAQSASFIPYLYKAIQAAGLSTGITCCDAEGWNDQVSWMSDLQSVLQYLSRITSHWYTSSGSSPMPNTGGLRVWETEYADLDSAWTTAWYSSGATSEGLHWANEIYQGIVTCQLSAYFYWWGTCPNAGNTGCLISLESSGAVASGRLWAFAMWSRYVRPNAVRVAVSGAPSNVLAAAFRNPDGTVAVVFTNNGASAASVSVSVSGFAASSVAAYHMDSSVSQPSTLSGAAVSGGKVTASLAAHGVVTLVISGSNSTAKFRPRLSEWRAAPVELD